MLAAFSDIRNRIELFSQKYGNIVYYSAWAIILLWFLYLNFVNWQTGIISNGEHGVKYWLDTGRYIDGAENLISGSPLIGREMQYTGYLAVLAILKIVNLPVGAVVILQILTAILAGYALILCGKMLTNSKIAGLFAAALFLCNPFIVSWHMYLLTESLYTSFVIFCLWSFAQVLTKRRVRDYLISAAILICTMLIRPNGWIMLPVAIIVYIVSLKTSNKYKLIFGFAVSLVFAICMSVIPLFTKNIQMTSPVVNLQKGVTVWNHEELNLKMPQEPNIDTTKWTSGFRYVYLHPGHSIKLASYRAGYTLIHIRPFHSTGYKLRVLVWIIPAYILAFIGFLYNRKNKISLAALGVIAAHLFVVAISYAEHDSRFDIYILPVFYLFAGTGLVGIKAFLYQYWSRA